GAVMRIIRQYNPQHFPTVATGAASFCTSNPHGRAQQSGTNSPRVNPPVLCATARSVPEEAAFEHNRYEQLAVAMFIEQDRDLVAVVALHRAHTPALARDPRADGERDPGPRGLGVRRVVVAVPAGARVVLPEVGEQERTPAAGVLRVAAHHRQPCAF